MNKEKLTIKEVADTVGVSYQAIYKRLNSTLKNYVVVENGRKLLKSEVLSEFDLTQSSTVKSTKSSTVKEDFKPSSSNNANEEELLKDKRRNEELIDDLRAQIKEKDEQIKNQSEHIIELSNRITELFDNNQKLQLNYQLLLGNGTEQNNEEVNIKENVEGARPYEEVKKESTRKGFLKRLLRK